MSRRYGTAKQLCIRGRGNVVSENSLNIFHAVVEAGSKINTLLITRKIAFHHALELRSELIIEYLVSGTFKDVRPEGQLGCGFTAWDPG